MSGDTYDIPEEQTNKAQQFYKSMKRMLETPEGMEFMEYARVHWSQNPLHDNPAKMGYNVGLNEIFKKLQQFQSGELIDERRSPEQPER